MIDRSGKTLPFFALHIVSGALALGIGVVSFSSLFHAGPSWKLQVVASFENTSEARVYFRNDRGFREADSSSTIVVGDGIVRAYRFPLAHRPLRELRLDPFLSEGKAVVQAVAIINKRGKILHQLALPGWQAANDIAAWEQVDDGFKLVTRQGASDPFLLYAMPETVKPPLGLGRLLASGLGGLLVTFLVWVAAGKTARWILRICPGSSAFLREWWSIQRPSIAILSGQPGRRFLLGGALCLLLCILGVRWWIVGAYGSDMPYWDQWDSDGKRVLIPYFEGEIGRDNWFATHNEHRVFFTRLTAFGLFLVNGQWDARVQAMFNALLPAATAAFLFFVFASLLAEKRLIGTLWLGMLLLFCLPYSWENTVGAFQNQFYFLIIFSVAALCLLPRAVVGSPRWFLGMAAAVGGIFTMAPGILAPAAGGGLAVVVAILGRFKPRRFISAWITFALCLGLGLWALSIIPEIPWHSGFRAGGAIEFIGAALVDLAWPVSRLFWLAPVLWLPFITFTVLYIGKRLPDDRRLDLLFGLGVWVILLALSTAYSRGSGMPLPIPRYTDPLSYGLLANLISLLVLCRASVWRKQPRPGPGFHTWKNRGYMLFGGAYGLTIGAALLLDAGSALSRELPKYRERLAVMEANVRGYVASGDFSILDTGVYFTTPHPNPHLIKDILDRPEIRAILPASVGPPAELQVSTSQFARFETGGIPQSVRRDLREVFWGSFDHEAHTNPDLPWQLKSFQATLTLAKPFPYVYFHRTGFFNTARRSLYFVNAESGQFTVVQGGFRTVDTVPVYHRIPPGQELIMAASGDNRHMEWIGFSTPRQMSQLSYRALRLSQMAPLVGFAGLVGALFWWLLPDRPRKNLNDYVL